MIGGACYTSYNTYIYIYLFALFVYPIRLNILSNFLFAYKIPNTSEKMAHINNFNKKSDKISKGTKWEKKLNKLID